MRGFKTIALLAALGCAAPSFAKDAVPEGKPGWSVTVTPRLQYLLFLPNRNADALEGLTSGGATVSIRHPDGRFALSATGLFGKGSGTYNFHDDVRRGEFSYAGNRKEIALLAEFTSPETNVTLFGGYHHFSADADEHLINGGIDSEVNSYRFSIDAAEIGLRLASRIGAGSRHAVSAQASFGVGPGRYKSNENRTLGGITPRGRP